MAVKSATSPEPAPGSSSTSVSPSSPSLNPDPVMQVAAPRISAANTRTPSSTPPQLSYPQGTHFSAEICEAGRLLSSYGTSIAWHNFEQAWANLTRTDDPLADLLCASACLAGLAKTTRNDQHFSNAMASFQAIFLVLSSDLTPLDYHWLQVFLTHLHDEATRRGDVTAKLQIQGYLKICDEKMPILFKVKCNLDWAKKHQDKQENEQAKNCFSSALKLLQEGLQGQEHPAFLFPRARCLLELVQYDLPEQETLQKIDLAIQDIRKLFEQRETLDNQKASYEELLELLTMLNKHIAWPEIQEKITVCQNKLSQLNKLSLTEIFALIVVCFVAVGLTLAYRRVSQISAPSKL